MANAVQTLFLRRKHLVFVAALPLHQSSAPTSGAVADRPQHPRSAIRAFEANLIDLGFVLHRDLNIAMQSMPPDVLKTASAWILETLQKDLGAHRPHVPLYRQFPENIPSDTTDLFVRRVLSWLYQEPEQPCLFCGKTDTVSALYPCSHLVCSTCWDGSNYSACPICKFHVHREHPFFLPAPEREKDQPKLSSGSKLKILHLCRDLDVTAREYFERLLARRSPLSPTGREDLLCLLEEYGRRSLTWLPSEIPVKETLATVFGTLLHIRGSERELMECARPYLKTATDVLRVLSVYSGHSGDLMPLTPSTPSPRHPVAVWLAAAHRALMPGAGSTLESKIKAQSKRTTLPRIIRRGFLEALERIPANLLFEDLRRHTPLWKWAGMRLHPFEYFKHLPNVALAFALIRKTRLDSESPLGRALLSVAAKYPDNVIVDGERLRLRAWAHDVEDGLRKAQFARVLSRLAERPGELMRRSDHVLRTILQRAPETREKFLQEFEKACSSASTPILLTLLTHLPSRTSPLTRRVFFPRGEVANLFQCQDDRSLLDSDSIEGLQINVETELLRRASNCPRVDRALLDARIVDLLIPFNERTTSRALVDVPRGSLLPVPGENQFRLFVHWMDKADYAVDLDLSVALFDEKWRFVGLCDFTNLSFAEGAAVHSGDFRSAPPPDGASEFVDLDLKKLETAGVRHVVVSIFSYTGISFDTLPEAFAGFLNHHGTAGPIFDASKVAQRFDLSGSAVIAVPMIIDIQKRQMLWTDVKFPSRSDFHSVGGVRGGLAHLGQDLTAYFGSNVRPTMWHLSCLHAAARAKEVWITARDGKVNVYRQRRDESLRAYYRRIVTHGQCDETSDKLAAGDSAAFFAGMEDNVPLHDGSIAYALRWSSTAEGPIKRLMPTDLIAEIAP